MLQSSTKSNQIPTKSAKSNKIDYYIALQSSKINKIQQNQQKPTKSYKIIYYIAWQSSTKSFNLFNSIQFHAFVGSGPQDLTNPYSPESSTKSYKIDYYIVLQSSTKSNKILQSLAFCSISCICWEKK